MRQHARQTQETHRDGEAARVVAAHCEEAETHELPVPRRNPRGRRTPSVRSARRARRRWTRGAGTRAFAVQRTIISPSRHRSTRSERSRAEPRRLSIAFVVDSTRSKWVGTAARFTLDGKPRPALRRGFAALGESALDEGVRRIAAAPRA